MEFVEWLNSAIEAKGWSRAEFARQTKLSPSQVTRLLNGERGIGEQSLNSIAIALKLPASLLFEKAGFLPSKPGLFSDKQRELLHLAETADEDAIDMAIAMLETAMKQKANRIKVAK